jgi:hypothetical protein
MNFICHDDEARSSQEGLCSVEFLGVLSEHWQGAEINKTSLTVIIECDS